MPDAITNLLCTEMALSYCNKNIFDWNNIYSERPSSLQKFFYLEKNKGI